MPPPTPEKEFRHEKPFVCLFFGDIQDQFHTFRYPPRRPTTAGQGPSRYQVPRGAAFPGGALGVREGSAVSTDTRRRAWALLSRAASGPCPALHTLIAQVGVEDAARAVTAGDVPVAVNPHVLERANPDAAQGDLDRMSRAGGRLVTPDDDEWPCGPLADFDNTDSCPDFAAPLALWVRGPLSLRVATENAIAVIGARCSTEYGNRVATDLAGALAVRGLTIVSGAAFGIDAMAHRATLAVGGATVAVMACGADLPYPSQHVSLLAEIAESGLIVSELPPGTPVSKSQFLARNRITAGLSGAVVAVEASMRSGTTNSIRWANRLQRPTFAIPGPVTSVASTGCNRMIADGHARLVTCAAEVLSALPASPPIVNPDAAGAGPHSAPGVLR
ncbi:DNA-processing protein DprA [Nocardia colli]|nr:DNA-processing protein DprA [Nocardia colli]